MVQTSDGEPEAVCPTVLFIFTLSCHKSYLYRARWSGRKLRSLFTHTNLPSSKVRFFRKKRGGLRCRKERSDAPLSHLALWKLTSKVRGFVEVWVHAHASFSTPSCEIQQLLLVSVLRDELFCFCSCWRMTCEVWHMSYLKIVRDHLPSFTEWPKGPVITVLHSSHESNMMRVSFFLFWCSNFPM